MVILVFFFSSGAGAFSSLSEFSSPSPSPSPSSDSSSPSLSGAPNSLTFFSPTTAGFPEGAAKLLSFWEPDPKSKPPRPPPKPPDAAPKADGLPRPPKPVEAPSPPPNALFVAGASELEVLSAARAPKPEVVAPEPKTLGFPAREAKPDVLDEARAPNPELANAVGDVWGLSLELLPNIFVGSIFCDFCAASASVEALVGLSADEDRGNSYA